VAYVRRKSSAFTRGKSRYRGVSGHSGRWEARIGTFGGRKNVRRAPTACAHLHVPGCRQLLVMKYMPFLQCLQLPAHCSSCLPVAAPRTEHRYCWCNARHEPPMTSDCRQPTLPQSLDRCR